MIGARRRARPGRRGARGGRRARRAVGVPRAAGRRTCTWSRSTARSSRRCARRSAPFDNATLHLADAVKLDFADARAGARQGRGEPALRRGGHRAAQVDRRAARARSSGSRWCSARWRERLAAAPGGEDLRRHLGASPSSPARCGFSARCRAPSSTRSRTWTRRSWCCAAARRRRRARWSPSCTPASPTGARRWPGSLALAPGAPDGHARARRARRSSELGHPPTPAPSGCRRTTGRGWPTRSAASASRSATALAIPPVLASSPTPSSTSSSTSGRAARRRPAPDLLALRLDRPRRRADRR